MADTAFIGFGVTGFPVAVHLGTIGQDVSVHERTAANLAKP